MMAVNFLLHYTLQTRTVGTHTSTSISNLEIILNLDGEKNTINFKYRTI